MVQNYKKNLTYASKSQEKISFFSFYKQISISKINLSFILVPDSGAIYDSPYILRVCVCIFVPKGQVIMPCG